jgi:predicted RNA-binding protein
MENIVKTYQTAQSNLKPLTKMVGMYGYAEKIKNLLSEEKDISLFVIYRAIEGTSKSEHSTEIRKRFLAMASEIKNSFDDVEKQAEMLLSV